MVLYNKNCINNDKSEVKILKVGGLCSNISLKNFDFNKSPSKIGREIFGILPKHLWFFLEEKPWWFLKTGWGSNVYDGFGIFSIVFIDKYDFVLKLNNYHNKFKWGNVSYFRYVAIFYFFLCEMNFFNKKKVSKYFYKDVAEIKSWIDNLSFKNLWTLDRFLKYNFTYDEFDLNYSLKNLYYDNFKRGNFLNRNSKLSNLIWNMSVNQVFGILYNKYGWEKFIENSFFEGFVDFYWLDFNIIDSFIGEFGGIDEEEDYYYWLNKHERNEIFGHRVMPKRLWHGFSGRPWKHKWHRGIFYDFFTFFPESLTFVVDYTRVKTGYKIFSERDVIDIPLWFRELVSNLSMLFEQALDEFIVLVRFKKPSFRELRIPKEIGFGELSFARRDIYNYKGSGFLMDSWDNFMLNFYEHKDEAFWRQRILYKEFLFEYYYSCYKSCVSIINEVESFFLTSFYKDLVFNNIFIDFLIFNYQYLYDVVLFYNSHYSDDEVFDYLDIFGDDAMISNFWNEVNNYSVERDLSLSRVILIYEWSVHYKLVLKNYANSINDEFVLKKNKLNNSLYFKLNYRNGFNYESLNNQFVVNNFFVINSNSGCRFSFNVNFSKNMKRYYNKGLYNCFFEFFYKKVPNVHHYTFENKKYNKTTYFEKGFLEKKLEKYPFIDFYYRSIINKIITGEYWGFNYTLLSQNDIKLGGDFRPHQKDKFPAKKDLNLRSLNLNNLFSPSELEDFLLISAVFSEKEIRKFYDILEFNCFTVVNFDLQPLKYFLSSSLPSGPLLGDRLYKRFMENSVLFKNKFFSLVIWENFIYNRRMDFLEDIGFYLSHYFKFIFKNEVNYYECGLNFFKFLFGNYLIEKFFINADESFEDFVDHCISIIEYNDSLINSFWEDIGLLFNFFFTQKSITNLPDVEGHDYIGNWSEFDFDDYWLWYDDHLSYDTLNSLGVYWPQWEEQTFLTYMIRDEWGFDDLDDIVHFRTNVWAYRDFQSPYYDPVLSMDKASKHKLNVGGSDLDTLQLKYFWIIYELYLGRRTIDIYSDEWLDHEQYDDFEGEILHNVDEWSFMTFDDAIFYEEDFENFQNVLFEHDEFLNLFGFNNLFFRKSFYLNRFVKNYIYIFCIFLNMFVFSLFFNLYFIIISLFISFFFIKYIFLMIFLFLIFFIFFKFFMLIICFFYDLIFNLFLKNTIFKFVFNFMQWTIFVINFFLLNFIVFEFAFVLKSMFSPIFVYGFFIVFFLLFFLFIFRKFYVLILVSLTSFILIFFGIMPEFFFYYRTNGWANPNVLPIAYKKVPTFDLGFLTPYFDYNGPVNRYFTEDSFTKRVVENFWDNFRFREEVIINFNDDLFSTFYPDLQDSSFLYYLNHYMIYYYDQPLLSWDAYITNDGCFCYGNPLFDISVFNRYDIKKWPNITDLFLKKYYWLNDYNVFKKKYMLLFLHNAIMDFNWPVDNYVLDKNYEIYMKWLRKPTGRFKKFDLDYTVKYFAKKSDLHEVVLDFIFLRYFVYGHENFYDRDLVYRLNASMLRGHSWGWWYPISLLWSVSKFDYTGENDWSNSRFHVIWPREAAYDSYYTNRLNIPLSHRSYDKKFFYRDNWILPGTMMKFERYYMSVSPTASKSFSNDIRLNPSLNSIGYIFHNSYRGHFIFKVLHFYRFFFDLKFFDAYVLKFSSNKLFLKGFNSIVFCFDDFCFVFSLDGGSNSFLHFKFIYPKGVSYFNNGIFFSTHYWRNERMFFKSYKEIDASRLRARALHTPFVYCFTAQLNLFRWDYNYFNNNY